MRRLCLILGVVTLLCSCSLKDKNVIFTGVVVQVYESGILVGEANLKSGDKAMVRYEKGCKKPAQLSVGDQVQVEILPNIRETYPLGVDAVEIIVVENEKGNEVFHGEP